MVSTDYRYEAKSLDAFVAQLMRYVCSGHYFYFTGRIPERKDVTTVDRKLVERYAVAKPRWARARRRLAGRAGIHYLRHGRFFVLIATHGQHQFFVDHATSFRDIRRRALHVGGYAIRRTYSAREKRWKIFVRLDRETYLNLRAQMLELAIRDAYRDLNALEGEFRRLAWQPYEPVRRQLVAIVKAVNRKRRYAGLRQIHISCVRTMRRIGTVFVDECSMATERAALGSKS